MLIRGRAISQGLRLEIHHLFDMCDDDDDDDDNDDDDDDTYTLVLKYLKDSIP